MAAALIPHSRYRQPVSPGRRAGALGLALALVALLVFALIRLGIAPSRLPGGRSLSTFTVLPDAEQAAEPASRPRRQARDDPRRERAQPPPPAPAPPPPPLPPNISVPGMILLSREEMAGADLARLPRAAAGDASAQVAAPDDSADAGAAPNGERLYVAEWYRKPPRNALALYLPNGAPAGSWATIACRTIDRYHVDSCVQLDDHPKGLGLSRALRNAAWQFLVRPPRLGGKPLIGAWVRIRFTFEAAPDER